MVRGDLREKYGIAPLKSYDDFLNYLITIGNKEPGIIPFNEMGTSDKMFWGLGGKYGWTGMGDALAVDTKLNDGKVFDLLERPETLAWALKNREVQLAGGFSKDVLSSKVDAETNFKNGTCAGYINGFGGPLTVYMDVMKSNPEWKPEIVDIQAGLVLTGSTPFDGGLAVHATSKNPLRALMMIDLLEGVKAYNDLLGLGVEGVHWTAVGDKNYESLSEGSNNYPAYLICPWGLNTNFMRSNSSTPDWVAPLRAKWVTQIGHPVTEGFAFDSTKVADKIAAVSGIAKPEMFALMFGLKEDPAAALAELNTKLKAAGLDDIKAEVQAQLDAYIASSK
jgi:putative aldouronate transport system substrate-binding protein